MTARYTVVLSKLAQEKFDRFIRADRKLGEQLAKAIERLAAHPELGEFLRDRSHSFTQPRNPEERKAVLQEEARADIRSRGSSRVRKDEPWAS